MATTEQLVFPLDKNDNPLYLDCLYKDIRDYIEQVNTSKNYLEGRIYINPKNEEERYIITRPTSIKDIRKSYSHLSTSEILKHVDLVHSKIETNLLPLNTYHVLTKDELGSLDLYETASGNYVIIAFNYIRFTVGKEHIAKKLKAGDYVLNEITPFIERVNQEIKELKNYFIANIKDLHKVVIHHIAKSWYEPGYIYVGEDINTMYRTIYSGADWQGTINLEQYKEYLTEYIKAKESKKPVWLRYLLKEIL